MSNPLAHHEVEQTRYSLLRNRAQSFCAAFLDLANNPPEKILDEHFTANNPKITEHGPVWAQDHLPFFSKTFTGRDGCSEHFKLLVETLEFVPNSDTFPPKEGFIIDSAASVGGEHGGAGKGWDGKGVVSVVGKARFKAVKTGK